MSDVYGKGQTHPKALGKKIMNHSQDSSKRVRIFGKIIASALLIFSLYCFWGVLIPVLKNLFKEGFELLDIMFLFIFPIPVSIFAGYCLVVARRLYKGLTKQSLRNVCFISSLIVFVKSLLIAGPILKPENSASNQHMWFESISIIICMIPAGLFYWLTNKYLMRWLGFDTSIDWKRREKAVSNFFGLMAFFIWGSFMSLAISLENAYDIDHLENAYDIVTPLWSLGVLFLPIILAFIFYRLSLRIAMHGCPKKKGQTSELAKANLPIE